MQNRSDTELLREYSEQGSDTAFREIVVRHTDLVYSAALRQVESTDLARDVAQTVFVDLARKAPAIVAKSQDQELIVGWLYRSTRYAALNLLRNERRRHFREQQAMEHLYDSEGSIDWEHVGGVLDEAMASLGHEDRDALLLRFFRNEDFRTIGTSLGISDSAAQKRVSRALDKLRETLARHGVTASATALSVVLCANAVKAAPLGLSATISTAAALSAPLTAGAIATHTMMNWINIKTITAVIAASVAVGTTTYVVQQGNISEVRGRNEALVATNAQVVSERDVAVAKITATQEQLKRWEKEKTELLQLRGEVGLLRRQSNDLAKLRQESQQRQASLKEDRTAATPSATVRDGTHFPKESWSFAGYATPEAAVETWTWAMLKVNKKVMLETLVPEQQDYWRQVLDGDPDHLEKEAKAASDKLAGFDLVDRKTVSDTEVIFTMVLNMKDGTSTPEQKYRIQFHDGGWRFAGPAK